jgi:4-amino-4-deoxy-L-arabinose transferase-like glycosyltransferase
MINEPRTYRRSPVQFILVFVVLVIFGISFLTTLSRSDYIALIPFGIIVGIAVVSTLYTMTQKTTISEDGISAQTFLGEKSLRWGEISRVSGRGNGIKLHNFDGDVTVVPSSQLPGYEEVVEWIGIKRPDLFNPLEYREMKRGTSMWVMLVVLMVALLGAGVAIGVLYLSEPGTPMNVFVPLIFIVVIFAIFFGITLSQPQSLTLDGRTLRVKYLSNEKTLLADEIESIDLRFSQTKNGKSYFILFTRKDKKTMRISGINPSLPIAYLVLKNWHGKNS